MREELHQQRRQKILQAARKVFLEKGFARAPVDDIARAARVSTATVYIYFATKDELFEGITDLALAPYEGLFDGIDQAPGGPEAILTRFAEAYHRFLSEPEVRAVYRTVVMEAPSRPAMGARMHEITHRMLGAVLRRRLEKFAASGDLVIADIAIAARLFQGMIEHSALTIPLVRGDEGSLHPAPEYCAEAVRAFLAAYGPR